MESVGQRNKYTYTILSVAAVSTQVSVSMNVKKLNRRGYKDPEINAMSQKQKVSEIIYDL